jgi:hypothetical protein
MKRTLIPLQLDRSRCRRIQKGINISRCVILHHAHRIVSYNTETRLTAEPLSTGNGEEVQGQNIDRCSRGKLVAIIFSCSKGLKRSSPS